MQVPAIEQKCCAQCVLCGLMLYIRRTNAHLQVQMAEAVAKSTNAAAAAAEAAATAAAAAAAAAATRR